MPLNKTPVYRNLGTRVTFLYLEYEDLIAVLLIAPVAFFLGSLFDRELFGIPMKLVFQWGIPCRDAPSRGCTSRARERGPKTLRDSRHESPP